MQRFVRAFTNVAYINLTRTQKYKYIPPPRDNIKTPADFLSKIGRDCQTVADKFTSWDHLFNTSSRDMEALGIKLAMRKHILTWRNWYSMGKELKDIPIPERRNKYLKLKEQVKLLRLKKLGLA